MVKLKNNKEIEKKQQNNAYNNIEYYDLDLCVYFGTL